MFPLPIIFYVKAGVVLVVLCGIFYSGWHMRDRDFTKYKNQVEIAAKEQEAHNKSIEAQHQLITKGIQDEYDAKLALIRQYYANGVRQPSSGTMSNLSTTTAIANATAAYNKLAEQCSETTTQLIELQKWINEQIGIK